ncbi:interleukin-18-like isoform X2 [Phyllobates terribilis]|uniref:interleukin-18-like isoform X2 n=2 Tax=Phyllobates terribilis TaxID=111132 RepID=UPI003CCAAF83
MHPGKDVSCSELQGHLMRIFVKMDRRRMSQDVVNAFKVSGGFRRFIKNALNELLIAKPEESIAIFAPDGDSKVEQGRFYIHKYRKDGENISGLPVIISCKIANRNYILEANNAESDTVKVTEGQLPQEIPSDSSGLVFYMQEFSEGHRNMCFESSLKKGCYLAWNKEKKLILKRRVPSDETISFSLV